MSGDTVMLVIFAVITIGVGYFFYNLGKTSQSFRILDNLVYELDLGDNLESNIRVYEELLEGELNYYRGNEDRMSETEKNRCLERIQASSDDLNNAKLELQNKIEEDPVLFREDQIIRNAKKELIKKTVHLAGLGKEETEDYLKVIKYK